jgi:hypothetical protein
MLAMPTAMYHDESEISFVRFCGVLELLNECAPENSFSDVLDEEVEFCFDEFSC